MSFSRAFFPVAVTVLIALAAIIISLGMTDRAIKESGHKLSHHSMELHLKNIQDFQETMLLDYTEWSMTFSNMTLNNDMAWFRYSIGGADIIYTKLHGMAFMKNDGTLIEKISRNDTAAYTISQDTFKDDFAFIKQKIMAEPAERPVPLSFFKHINGTPALISFSPITHPDPTAYPDFSPDQRDFMIFWTILTPELLSQTSEDLRLQNLSFTPKVSPENFSLADSKGKVISSLQWSLKKQDTNPLSLSLNTSLAMFALLLLGGYFSHRRIFDLIRQLDHARKEAETGHRIKSEFLATMSHELRTPLNSIIGFSDVLSKGIQGSLNPQQNEYVGYIHSSGEHLLTIINEILDMSKIEAGKYEITEGEVDINATIQNCNILLGKAADDKGILLEEDLEESIEDMIGDVKVIKQILLNIINNALKFTPKEGYVKVRSMMSKDGGLKVTIEDTGCGISPDKLDLILKPYVQVGNHKTRSQHGTGLGLAISDAFMKMHQGTLEIESVLNKGTCVILTFPANRIFAPA